MAAVLAANTSPQTPSEPSPPPSGQQSGPSPVAPDPATTELSDVVKTLSEAVTTLSSEVEGLRHKTDMTHNVMLGMDGSWAKLLHDAENSPPPQSAQLSAQIVELVKKLDNLPAPSAATSTPTTSSPAPPHHELLREVKAAMASVIESRPPVVVDAEAIGQGAVERLREVSVEHELALGKAVKRIQAETVEVVEGELQAATKLLDKAVATADKATATAEKVAADVHWRGVGRLAMAITPAAAILLAIALLVWPVTAALQIGPLVGWSVGQMLDASGWWLAAWIGVHVAVAGLLVVGIKAASEWLSRRYRFS